MTPDLCTLGKAVGGGLPLSVFGGRKEVMDRLMPAGDCQHSGTYNGHVVAVAAALYFNLRSGGDQAPTALADEHGLSMQRFYNLLCLVYGNDPVTYADLPTTFPDMEQRSARCEDEYDQKVSSWSTLLGPHAL